MCTTLLCPVPKLLFSFYFSFFLFHAILSKRVAWIIRSQRAWRVNRRWAKTPRRGRRSSWRRRRRRERERGATGGSRSQGLEGLAEGLRKALPKLPQLLKPRPKTAPPKVLDELSLEGVAKLLRTGSVSNVIVMTGAGISTAAGIPDFRSPGSGLYHNLQKYDLPHPQAIFQIDFFHENPKPFFTLAKELFPGHFKPTTSHFFIKLLEKKNRLLRTYTQNIDTLEHVAEMDPDLVVEAHGTFRTSHCLSCKTSYSLTWIKEEIFGERVPRCSDEDCGGLVKPDIVFFGENLPAKFFYHTKMDFPMCDLLLVMGTSLVVQVARDVFWEGTCDDGCRQLAVLCGWEADLDKLIQDHGNKDSSTSTLSSL